MRCDLRDEESIEVQMAPLIDCVFLLLIFFLVSSTLKKIDRELPLELPDVKAAVDVQQPDVYAVISVDRTGNYYLDGTPITIAALQSDMRSKALEDPDWKIRLDADREVPFERVMQVIDLLRFEGLRNVSVNSKRHTT